MAKKISSYNRLERESWLRTDKAQLHLSRNLSLGAAAACLILLSQILTIGAKDLALEVSVIAAAIGMPLWIMLAVVCEVYISLGEDIYPHIRNKWVQRIYIWILLLASFALVISVGGVIWHLTELGVKAYIVTILISVFVGYGIIFMAARWWYGTNGPGNNGDENDS